MEVLVFFVVLITNKSRIRKSLFSRCRWRVQSGLLGEVLLPANPFNRVSRETLTNHLRASRWLVNRMPLKMFRTFNPREL